MIAEPSMEEPPYDTKGKVMPLAGTRLKFTAKWMAACRTNRLIRPLAASLANGELADRADFIRDSMQVRLEMRRIASELSELKTAVYIGRAVGDDHILAHGRVVEIKDIGKTRTPAGIDAQAQA